MKSDLEQIRQFLKTHRFMSIATCDEDIWIANVYYVIDDFWNVYFLSNPKTEHCIAIENNPRVACAVADSTQSVTDKKVGVQFRGIASKVRGLETMKWMLALWCNVNTGFEHLINIQNIQKKAIKSRIYKVEIKRIKFFNDELYGDKETETFEISN